MSPDTTRVPIIDVGPLFTKEFSDPAVKDVVNALRDACSTWGFFEIIGHQVPLKLQRDLVQLSKAFFALPEEKKLAIDVRKGGPAWRGYMPMSGESTHGVVDRKEGIYFGPEHSSTHELLGMPLHGQNRFPPEEDVPGMKDTVLDYIERVTEVGKQLTTGLSLALGLDSKYMNQHLLEPEPVALFRFFRYPPNESGVTDGSGIGEHSDFGFLTILMQDSPGLQVMSPSGEWVDVPVIEGAFVVNVGDMFDMLTGGRFVSRRHRALSPPAGGPDRHSFPFFFDFSWTAEMKELPIPEDVFSITEETKAEAKARWATTTFKSVEGRWWQYLAKKVRKVFPDLNLPDFDANTSVSSRFNMPVITAPATGTP
ncbi:2og-fe oxygenase [Moniliophthora roreri MCA 2997]|uniref:2og-fe oxygenase n=1 Tax=Moniliophthora roreri (strain MCA 2997) TaxID=1381753 RepID=V2X7A0_MONRO|nr:2og-fe oxygenase [Moniliophthora roreri MCA 2997]